MTCIRCKLARHGMVVGILVSYRNVFWCVVMAVLISICNLVLVIDEVIIAVNRKYGAKRAQS